MAAQADGVTDSAARAAGAALAHRSVMGRPLMALAPQARSGFLARGRPVTWERGEVLLRQGDQAGDVLVLVAGRAFAVAGSSQGKEVLLSVHGPGDLVGDLTALDGQPRVATIRALEGGSGVRLAREVFLAGLRDNPDLSLAMLRLAATRLRDTSARVIEHASDDLQTRVARRLLEVAAGHARLRDDGALAVTMEITQEQLATWVGASREKTAKCLAGLRRQDLLEVGRGTLVLLDVEQLRQLARL